MRDAGQRAAIGLIAACLSVVVAAGLGQRQHFIASPWPVRSRWTVPRPAHAAAAGSCPAACARRAAAHSAACAAVTFGLPSRSPPIQRAQAQEALRPMRQQALPARIEPRQHRQEHIAQVGERDLHFVRDLDALAPQRPRLPQQRDLPQDAPARRSSPSGVSSKPSVALAASARRCGCDGRSCSCASPRSGCAVSTGTISAWSSSAPPAGFPLPRPRQPAAAARRRRSWPESLSAALPVLGQVGEHREQHEAAHEGERVVQAQRSEAVAVRRLRGHAPMAVHRSARGCSRCARTASRRRRRGSRRPAGDPGSGCRRSG